MIRHDHLLSYSSNFCRQISARLGYQLQTYLAQGAIRLDQAVLALDHVSVSALIVGLAVAGVGVFDPVREGVVWLRLEQGGGVRHIRRCGD